MCGGRERETEMMENDAYSATRARKKQSRSRRNCQKERRSKNVNHICDVAVTPLFFYACPLFFIGVVVLLRIQCSVKFLQIHKFLHCYSCVAIIITVLKIVLRRYSSIRTSMYISLYIYIYP